MQINIDMPVVTLLIALWGAGVAAKVVNTLPEWKRKKLVIFFTRLSNDDKEAEELGNMLLAKKISSHQFLTMI